MFTMAYVYDEPVTSRGPLSQFARSILFLLLALSTALGVTAQSIDLIPQRGIYPNGSYTFDKLEAINKQNGILSYTIPITSMPLGRGGMTWPINLVYSSALADAFEEPGYDGVQPVCGGRRSQAPTAGGGSHSTTG